MTEAFSTVDFYRSDFNSDARRVQALFKVRGWHCHLAAGFALGESSFAVCVGVSNATGPYVSRGMGGYFEPMLPRKSCIR